MEKYSQFKNSDMKLIISKDDYEYKLKDKNKFVGYRGDANKPSAVIIKNNNLHFEIIINPKAFSVAHDIAGISDVIAESPSQLFVTMKIVWLQLTLMTK